MFRTFATRTGLHPSISLVAWVTELSAPASCWSVIGIGGGVFSDMVVV
jgi:hypothetical protein